MGVWSIMVAKSKSGTRLAFELLSFHTSVDFLWYNFSVLQRQSEGCSGQLITTSDTRSRL